MPVTRRSDLHGPALVFITTTVVDWIPVFSNDSAALAAALQLRDVVRQFDLSVAGYVVMPSHIHALIGFPDISYMSRVMQAFKSLTSRCIKDLNICKPWEETCKNDRFVLWKRRFDDLVVYSERQFRVKLEYIHSNPVRAGLVANATDWKYSSARDWILGEKGLIEIDRSCTWLSQK
jgi:putative transposase